MAFIAPSKDIIPTPSSGGTGGFIAPVKDLIPASASPVQNLNQTPEQHDTFGQRIAGAVPNWAAGMIESQNQPLLPKDFDVTRAWALPVRETPAYMKQQFTPHAGGDIAPEQQDLTHKLGRLLVKLAPGLFSDYGGSLPSTVENKGVLLQAGDALGQGVKNINKTLVDISSPTVLAQLPALAATAPESAIGTVSQRALKSVVAAQMTVQGAQHLQTAFDESKSLDERRDALQNAILIGAGVGGLVAHGSAVPVKDYGIRGIKSLVGPDIGPSPGGPIIMGSRGQDQTGVMQNPGQMLMPPGLSEYIKAAQDRQALLQRLQSPAAQLPEQAQSPIDLARLNAELKLQQAQDLQRTSEQGFVAGARGVADKGNVAQTYDVTAPRALIGEGGRTEEPPVQGAGEASKPPFMAGARDVQGNEGVAPFTREMLHQPNVTQPLPKLTSAAIRLADGRVFRGQIHATADIAAIKAGVPNEEIYKADRGFIDDKNKYYTKAEVENFVGTGKAESKALGLKPKTGLGGEVMELHSGVKPDMEKVKELGLRSALMVNGEAKIGDESTRTHADITRSLVKQAATSDEKVKVLEAQIDDTKHVFVDKQGKVYNRAEAGKAVGLEEGVPLHSEMLPSIEKPTGETFIEKNSSSPVKLLVTPSSKEQGKWQVSGFTTTPDGTIVPQGDSLFNSKEEAVASIPQDKFMQQAKAPAQKLYSGAGKEEVERALAHVKKNSAPLLAQIYQRPDKDVIHTRPDGTTTKVNVDVKKHLDALKDVTSTPLERRPDYAMHIGEKAPMTEQLVMKANKLMNAVSDFTHLIKPIDAIMDELGAGKGTYDGYLMKNFRGPVDDRYNTKLQLQKVFIRPVLDYVKQAKLTMQNAERINVYANAMQEGGRERMIAMGIPEADIDKIVKGITPSELKAYHMMRGAMDATAPEMVATIKRIGGGDVKLVDNYWPMPRDYDKHVPVADEVITGTVDSHGTYDSQRSAHSPHGTADVTPGSTISRVRNAKTAIQLNAFETFQDHMEERAHLLAMGDTLVKLGQIARSAEFKEKFGDHGQAIILDWLNTVAAQGRVGKQVKTLNIIRNNLAKSTIGMRLSSQFVHSANIALAVQRTGGVGNWYTGLSDSMTERGQEFLEKNFAETIERGSSEPTVAEASQGNKAGWVFGIERSIDRLNAQATVLGAYRNELAKAGKDASKYLELPLDVQARNKALVLTRRAVASPLYKDTPPMIARGGSGTKMLLQYQNTMLDIWSNLSHDLWTAGVEKVLQNKWGDKSAPAMQAVKMSIAIGAMLLAASAVKYQFKHGVKEVTKAIGRAAGMQPVKEAPDSYWGEVSKEALRFPPLAGQLASAMEYKETGIPLLDQGATALNDLYIGATGKHDSSQKNPSTWMHEKGLIKGLIEALGFTRFGAGSGQYGDVIMGLLKQEHANETGRGLDRGEETGNENAPPKVVRSQTKKVRYTINN